MNLESGSSARNSFIFAILGIILVSVSQGIPKIVFSAITVCSLWILGMGIKVILLVSGPSWKGNFSAITMLSLLSTLTADATLNFAMSNNIGSLLLLLCSVPISVSLASVVTFIEFRFCFHFLGQDLEFGQVKTDTGTQSGLAREMRTHYMLMFGVCGILLPFLSAICVILFNFTTWMAISALVGITFLFFSAVPLPKPLLYDRSALLISAVVLVALISCNSMYPIPRAFFSLLSMIALFVPLAISHGLSEWIVAGSTVLGIYTFYGNLQVTSTTVLVVGQIVGFVLPIFIARSLTMRLKHFQIMSNLDSLKVVYPRFSSLFATWLPNPDFSNPLSIKRSSSLKKEHARQILVFLQDLGYFNLRNDPLCRGFAPVWFRFPERGDTKSLITLCRSLESTFASHQPIKELCIEFSDLISKVTSESYDTYNYQYYLTASKLCHEFSNLFGGNTRKKLRFLSLRYMAQFYLLSSIQKRKRAEDLRISAEHMHLATSLFRKMGKLAEKTVRNDLIYFATWLEECTKNDPNVIVKDKTLCSVCHQTISKSVCKFCGAKVCSDCSYFYIEQKEVLKERICVDCWKKLRGTQNRYIVDTIHEVKTGIFTDPLSMIVVLAVFIIQLSTFFVTQFLMGWSQLTLVLFLLANLLCSLIGIATVFVEHKYSGFTYSRLMNVYNYSVILFLLVSQFANERSAVYYFNIGALVFCFFNSTLLLLPNAMKRGSLYFSPLDNVIQEYVPFKSIPIEYLVTWSSFIIAAMLLFNQGLIMEEAVARLLLFINFPLSIYAETVALGRVIIEQVHHRSRFYASLTTIICSLFCLIFLGSFLADINILRNMKTFDIWISLKSSLDIGFLTASTFIVYETIPFLLFKSMRLVREHRWDIVISILVNVSLILLGRLVIPLFCYSILKILFVPLIGEVTAWDLLSIFCFGPLAELYLIEMFRSDERSSGTTRRIQKAHGMERSMHRLEYGKISRARR